MEDPGLGVQPRRLLVIGDADLRIGEGGEALDRHGVRGAHVSGGQDSEAAAAATAVALQGAAELLEAGELHEGAEEVDPIGALELAPEVVEERFPFGVDDEVGGVERAPGWPRRIGRLGGDGTEPLRAELELARLEGSWGVPG